MPAAPRSSPCRPLLAALVAALVGFAPLEVRAQGAVGPDEVAFKSGGFVRGTIIAVEPGSVVIVFVDGLGLQRIIPWGDVERIERGKYAPTEPPQGAPVLGPPVWGAPGYVRLHIDTTSPSVELFRLRSTRERGEIHESLCHAPCDAFVDGRGDQSFRIGGDDVMPSPTFSLGDRTGNVSLSVSPGSRGRWSVGIDTAIWGSVGMVGSLALFVTGGVLPKPEPPGMTGGNNLTSTPFYAAGGALLGVGVGLITTGIVLIYRSQGEVVLTTPPEVTISSRGLHLTPAGPVLMF